MFEMELERFKAEAGCGMAELKFIPPSVWLYQYIKSECSQLNSLLVAGAH